MGSLIIQVKAPDSMHIHQAVKDAQTLGWKLQIDVQLDFKGIKILIEQNKPWEDYVEEYKKQRVD